jgi:hypothetical protein
MIVRITALHQDIDQHWTVTEQPPASRIAAARTSVGTVRTERSRRR